MLRSCPCTQAQLESAPFQAWAGRIGEERMRLHRKVWEWAFIAQALYERGMLDTGRRGVGFGVGQEPLPALFASLGCEILATDGDLEGAQASGWAGGGMYAGSCAGLNRTGCDPDLFRQAVTFRVVDMRQMPQDLGDFDFLWSACSMEHLGTMAAGERFLFESLEYLKPGGVAVHTTEYNVESNTRTKFFGRNTIFRRRDVERIRRELVRRGYRMEEPDWSTGDLPGDQAPDPLPWSGAVHLKLALEGYVATSFGLIVERPA